jgi:uncharacterized membrane protein
MSKKHMLIMVVCCLIPIAAFTAISVFKVPVSAVVYGAIMLFCPLSHILMMKFMMHDHQPDQEHQHHHPEIIDADVK